MSFLDLQAWPQGLLRLFQIKRQNTGNLESRYYGPYDAMLNRCFDTGDDTYHFFVSPQQLPPESHRDVIDFQLELIVRDERDNPVLIVEIKDDCYNALPSTRNSADKQIRSRFGEFLVQCPLRRLYAISFLGTRMRVYCGDAGSLLVDPSPVQPPSQFHVFPPTFSQGEWVLDVLSQEGLEKMQGVVRDIRSMAGQV